MPKMARLGLPRSEKARASPGNERNVESRRNQDSTVVPKMPNGFSGAERSSGIPATSRLARGGFSIDRAAHVGFAEPIDQVVALTAADPGLERC
jgi:hypothetical protein